MHPQLHQQVVWITGASSGIGAAMARAFSMAGAFVILSARRRQALESVAASLPNEAMVLPLDLTDQSAIGPAAEQALAWRGRVDVLVNNAGVSQRSETQHTKQETARRLMEVNFFCATALTAAVLPAMLSKGQGHIVNMTSVAAYVAAPERAYYSASKHALRAWSNTLRAELGGSGVHVTMVCPGFVSTDISKKALDGEGIPIGRPDPQVSGGLTAEEVALQVLPALRGRKREVRIGGVEIMAIYWQRFCPWIVAWVIPDCVPEADSGMLWGVRGALRAVWGLPAPKRLSREQAAAQPELIKR